MNKQEYSIGFMFTENMKQMLLIKKGHGPKCVIGRWNGIGGHIEPTDVDPMACQIREFEEETGVKTSRQDWYFFTKLQGADFIVHCFWGRNTGAVLNAKTMTDERIEIINIDSKYDQFSLRLSWEEIELAPNLRWMIPFLCDTTTYNHLCVVLATYCKDDNLDTNPATTI